MEARFVPAGRYSTAIETTWQAMTMLRPHSNEGSGRNTRSTSPATEPTTTASSTAVELRSEHSESASIVAAHAEPKFRNRKPATVARPSCSLRANCSTSKPVIRHPSAMMVTVRRSSSDGLRVATTNNTRKNTAVPRVENSRAMP